MNAKTACKIGRCKFADLAAARQHLRSRTQIGEVTITAMDGRPIEIWEVTSNAARIRRVFACVWNGVLIWA